MGISDIARSLLPKRSAPDSTITARQTALERKARENTLDEAGLAELLELRGGHGPRAVSLARKDVELRAVGKALEIGEAAELLHLQAGIDSGHALIGADYARTGQLPARSSAGYLKTIASAQARSPAELYALDRVRGDRAGWENVSPRILEALDFKRALELEQKVLDGINAAAATPRDKALPNIRARTEEERPNGWITARPALVWRG